MVNQSNYPKDEVEACLSVMVELMTLFGEFRDYFVIVGGWVPYFLVGYFLPDHYPVEPKRKICREDAKGCGAPNLFTHHPSPFYLCVFASSWQIFLFSPARPDCVRDYLM